MSELHSFSAQFIIFIQSTHKLNEKYSLSDITSYNHLANERIAFISKVCQIFKKSTIIVVIILRLMTLFWELFK